MAQYLVDTNILIRAFEIEGKSVAKKTIASLLRNGHLLHVTPQVVVEFWCVSTRPFDVNGLGWDIETTTTRVIEILTNFKLIQDSPNAFNRWLALVQKYEVKGKRTHDARLVAVMLENGVDTLLTFNTGDFEAFKEIKVIHPADVVANAT